MYSMKSVLHSIKNSLHSINKILHSIKRALNSIKIPSKETYISSNECYISSKEPYIHFIIRPLDSLKEYSVLQCVAVCCSLSKEPYIPTNTPYILSKEPYTLSKEPYILSKEPYKSMLRVCTAVKSAMHSMRRFACMLCISCNKGICGSVN